jgi:LacI family transcriptional regulator
MAKIRKVIVLVETSRAYGRGLLRGIAKYSRLHGPWIFYHKPPYYRHPAHWVRVLSHQKKLDADGIIMVEQEKPEDIIAMGLPTIASPYIKDRIAGAANIIGDNDAMGEMAAEHLLDRGFNNFAYCGFEDMFGARSRGESFRRRIAEAGFRTNIYKKPRPRGPRSWEDEQIFMADWLKSLPKPVGLMTCTDDRSQDVIEACKIAALHVPEEVAIIGVDNDELVCELSSPPLSSIALNTQRSGYEAAELLDKMMSRKRIKLANQTVVVHPTHIVTRQSTDILAMADGDVVAAIRFIRRHAKEMIQVDDVVNTVAVSRRSLEQRFRRELGRSVLAEIKRARVDQVARMLVETNLSVSQIALALGYAGVENIARYFRSEKGMSPLAYRKLYGQK